MSYRLLGTWQSEQRDIIFEPRSSGIGGKSAATGLVYREIDRQSGAEKWRGTLMPDLDDGLLRGDVLSPPLGVLGTRDTLKVSAWVDDLGRLWMANFAEPYNGRNGKFFTRVPVTADAAKVQRWTGRWNTNRGILEVSAEGSNFVAWIHRDGGKKERVAFGADLNQASGAWDTEYADSGVWLHKPVNWGDLNLTLSADGQSFTGWYSIKKPGAIMGMERRNWTGQRVTQPSRPPAQPIPTQPVPQQPSPSTPEQPAPQQPIPQRPSPQQPLPQLPAPATPSTQPGPMQPTPPVSSPYKPLNRIDVRVDRVVVARGYPTYQVHAFVTVKNTSASPQYFTSGFMKAVLADADGVGWERSQPYRASGEPAALFGSTPVIQPGGELKVRYVFTPPDDVRLTSLTLSEGGQSAEFPVSL